MIFKKMHCKGGVFIPTADVHRRGVGGCQPMDMYGHGGGGGQKSRKKLRTSFVNGPLRAFKFPYNNACRVNSNILFIFLITDNFFLFFSENKNTSIRWNSYKHRSKNRGGKKRKNLGRKKRTKNLFQKIKAKKKIFREFLGGLLKSVVIDSTRNTSGHTTSVPTTWFPLRAGPTRKSVCDKQRQEHYRSCR